MSERRIKVVAAIIAGGTSQRMRNAGIQGDKFLQNLDHRTLIEYAYQRLKTQIDDVFINANGDAERLSFLNAPIIQDEALPHGGPLAGIYASLKHAQEADYLLTIAADTPFFPHDLLSKLIRKADSTKAEIVIAKSLGRYHPTFGLWQPRLIYNLREWLQSTDKASIMKFSEKTGFEIVEFDPVRIDLEQPAIDPFFNINEPADLDEAKRNVGYFKL